MVPPSLVLEHFRLRRWLFVVKDDRPRGDAVGREHRQPLAARRECGGGRTQVLTAPDPLHDPFLVYAHGSRCSCLRAIAPMGAQGAGELLRAESPAHTRWYLRFVEPRFRVGVQSMIGFDSVVGCVPQGVTLGEGALGRAPVLTGPPQLAGGAAIALDREGRIGTTAQLS